MLQIIGQPLLAYLYLLLTTYPRLAGALALFVLVFLGAVIIRAFSRIRRRRQEGYYDMAVPDGFSDSPHLAGGGGQVKTSSTTSTTAPVAPITPVLAPFTRTSSSSTSSSDLLLPLPTNINRRSSSWPPVAPIPWRSSWGFLDEDQVVALDEGDEEEDEDTPTEQGHGHGHGPGQLQEPRQETTATATPLNTKTNTNTGADNNNFLTLPATGTSRRTGSMEARKGSACTISGLEDIHGLQRLELGIPAPQSGKGDDDAGSPADLVGVGGQFQFHL